MASTIKVDNVQNQPGTNIVSKCGTDVTLGASGDTVALACGASQTGFGRTGTVDWVTTPKVTGDSPVTAATGSGYFLNTTAGEITINLPAGAAGSIVSLADYAATWQTNKVTVAPNGSEKIGGVNVNVELTTEGQSVTLVYVDSTQGWINTMDSTSNVRGAFKYVTATGGTPCAGTTCGDYKIHKFTGPGTFCVSCAGDSNGSNSVEYIVVAGGAGGGKDQGGGGGAGGLRDNFPSPATAGLAVTATPYSIVVGSGGTQGPGSGVQGGDGGVSTFSTICSAGGGGGGHAPTAGTAGGSGGGGGTDNAGGAGNTPSTPCTQGYAGGTSSTPAASGGGGGKAAVGAATSSGVAGAGGIGKTFPTDIAIPGTGTPGPSPGAYFGGGGGGSAHAPGGTNAAGGSGGGGKGGGNPANPPATTVAGTVNTGGGGGGNGQNCSNDGTGGSGIVIIRYKFQN